MKVALGVSYDGCGYHGWQTQPEGFTVQDRLEKAISQFVGEKVPTFCAGRTDTGVHATAQVVHLDSPVERVPQSWVRGLNSYLPRSIAVRWAQPVADDFHARFSARSRTYEYWIYNDAVRSPIYDGRAAWIFRHLDVEKMREGAQHLLGEHDFSSFRAAECQAATPVRDLYELDVERRGKFVRLRFRANAFLQHMVRNITGTLVYVGTGARPADWVAEVLEAKNREIAAPTIYASGLYFVAVEYDAAYGLPAEPVSPFPG